MAKQRLSAYWVPLEVVCSPPVTAYGGAATGGESGIYRSCDGDAAGAMTLIAASDLADSDQNRNPVLSPDGSQILFSALAPSSGYDEVWVVDAAPGSTPVQLAADPTNYLQHPAWGADNDTFVYCHFASGTFDGGGIYKDTVSAPGSPTLLKAAAGGYSPKRPQFNFDGTRVAYIWEADSTSACDLRVMDADGSNDSLLDNTIKGYLYNDPPQFGWANTTNKIAYSDAETTRNTFVINDDGTGKTQIDANGDAAPYTTNVSGFPFAPDDSFVVITGDAGLGYISVFRAELDGSNTTALGSTGPESRNWFRAAIVYSSRIWFISRTGSTGVGILRSMALDGTDEVQNFRSSLGTGDQVLAFAGGDGFYYN